MTEKSIPGVPPVFVEIAAQRLCDAAERKAQEKSATQSELADYQQPDNYAKVAYVAVPTGTLAAAVAALRAFEEGIIARSLAKETADLLQACMGRLVVEVKR